MTRALVVLLIVTLAGCATPAAQELPATLAPGAPAELHWSEPRSIVRGTPALFAHEQGANGPDLAVAPDGTLYLQFSGCSNGTPFPAKALVEANAGAEASFCTHQPIMRSLDGGETWTPLNDVQGRLSADAPATNEAGGVAVDAAGTVYVAEAGCITTATNTGPECDSSHVIVQRSVDRGETWRHLGDVKPPGAPQARSLSIAAGEEGHLVLAWKTGNMNGQSLSLTASFDAGETFTEPVVLQGQLDNLGSIVIDQAGGLVYLPYPVGLGLDPPTSELRVAFSRDGGRRWEESATGILVEGAPGSVPCQQGTPSIAVHEDGAVLLVYTSRLPDGTFELYAATSDDGARTWGTPARLEAASNNAVPRVSSRGPEVLLAWGANDARETEVTWDLRASRIEASGMLASVLVEPVIARHFEDEAVPFLLTPLNGAPAGNDIGTLLATSIAALDENAWGMAYVAHPSERGGIAEIRWVRSF